MLAFDATFTMGNLLTIVGMGAGIVIGAWRLRSGLDKKLDTVASDLKSKAWQKDLDQLKLEMTRDFVTAGQMTATEARMTAHLDAVTTEIRGLRSDMISMLRELAAK